MKKTKAVGKEILSWILVLVFALVITAGLNSKVFATAVVHESSMENTLFADERLIVNKFNYNFSKPQRGDIIVFLEEEEKGSLIKESSRFFDSMLLFFTNRKEIEEKYPRLVKRVIGIPGDVIEIKEHLVYVNGKPIEEHYIKNDTEAGDIEFPLTVGQGELFVLGDNRKVSLDSRDFGAISIKQVEGKVSFRFSPMKKMGSVK